MEIEAPTFVYHALAPIGDDKRSPHGKNSVVDQSESSSGVIRYDRQESLECALEPTTWNDADSSVQVKASTMPATTSIISNEREPENEYLSLNPNDETESVVVEKNKLPRMLSINLNELPSPDPAFPWIQRINGSTLFRSPLLQLHQEILDFSEFISSTEEEHIERESAIQRVTEVIKLIWPNCKVEVFGSFATGLYLPTSDVDMVIMDSGCPPQLGLRSISKVLRKKSLARNLVVIGRAKVPIIKFVEVHSGISFDISFDLQNGPDAAIFIKDALSSLPPLRPLSLVLKIFLQQRELNEVYTGGIGSYALLIMIMAHLQLHPSRQIYGSLEKNLGILLIDFFDLYGRALNVKDVGISCASGGRFFSKISRGFFDFNKPYLLSVEDPQVPENDIGKNSYNSAKVRSAFSLANRLLNAPEDGMGENVGILGRIIRYDEKMINRRHHGPLPTYVLNAGNEGKSKKRRRDNEGNADGDGDEMRNKKKQKKKTYEESEEAGGRSLSKKQRRKIKKIVDEQWEAKPFNKKKRRGSSNKREHKESESLAEEYASRHSRKSSRTNYTDHYDNGNIMEDDNSRQRKSSSHNHSKKHR